MRQYKKNSPDDGSNYSPRYWVKVTITAAIAGVIAWGGIALINYTAKKISPEPPTTNTTPKKPENKSSELADKNTVKRNSNKLAHNQKPPIKENPQQINPTNSNVLIGPVNAPVNQTVTVNEFPEPKFSIKPIRKNVPENNTFKTEYQLIIDAKAPLKNLYLEAIAPSIINFVVACPSGIGGHAGKREGFAFDNIPFAFGPCTLSVVTSKPDEVNFTYDYLK